MRDRLVIVILIGLVFFALFEVIWLESYLGRLPTSTINGVSFIKSKPSSVSTATLVKFGNPIPQKVEGPYFVLLNKGYVAGYDAGIEDPLWVETRFFAIQKPSSTARPREFASDLRIKAPYQVNTTFWTGSGYDRGHMAPNWGVSICYGREAQIQSFLLTNVIPQSPELNRGLWETLEKIISNDYAERFGQVWVICEPLFKGDLGRLKDGKVKIPDGCYKIILRLDAAGTPHVLAFEMPQALPMDHQEQDLQKYLTTVSKIERDTKIMFFPDLPVGVRQDVEESEMSKMW